MDPELKEYLDAWSARCRREFDDIRACFHALDRSMEDTTKLVTASVGLDEAPAPPPTIATSMGFAPASCVVRPMQASFHSTELVTATVGLAELPAPAPTIATPLGVAPVVPIDTSAMVPASCSTECAQAITASTTTTLLPWASMSSSSPATSGINGVVSTELAPDNGADEHGASLASYSLSSSPTEYMAWEDASPMTPTSCTDPIEGGHIAPVDAMSAAIIAEVAALTCFKPEQNTTFSTSGVTTMAVLQKGVPELVHVAATFCASATPANSGKTTLQVVPSTSVGFITIVPVTCLTYCLSQQPTTVPRPVASSPPTPTEYSDRELFGLSPSRRITSRVPVHRPTPWPSFMDLHANGDETRPRPWPSFISYCGGGRHKQSGLPPQVRYASLMQWKPWTSKKPTCLAAKNLGTQECLIVTACCADRRDWCTMTCATRWSSPNYADSTPTWLRTNFNDRDTSAAPFNLSSSMLSHNQGNGCILWMVLDTVDERCNSEGCSVHPNSVQACSHETVLLSMWEHQLSVLLLNYHVQISICSVKFSNSVSPNEFLFHWYIASSALSPDHLFERELSVTVPTVLALFTSQEAGPGIKIQSNDLCFLSGALIWHVGLLNLSVFYQHFTDIPSSSSWYFTMQLKMIWDPGTVQIMFSTYMSDKLVSAAIVAIWWFPSAPCKYPVAFSLHQAHRDDSCLHSGALWNDLITSSNSRLWPQKCMHDVHLIIVKSKQQVAVYSNCLADLSSMAICEVIIQTNFIVVCYGAGGIVAWSVFITTLRPTAAYALLDTMKHNNSKRSSRALILAFQDVTAVSVFESWNPFGKTITLIWESQFMALINSRGISFHELCLALFSWTDDWLSTKPSGGVQYTQLTWDPGGFTWYQWFSPCHYEGPIQGGRCMPALGRHKELRSPWDLGSAATGNQLKGCYHQWDPGRFSTASAWGQAEFQGGRDVRSQSLPYRYLCLGWHHGPPHWPSLASTLRAATTYTWKETTLRSSRRIRQWYRRRLPLLPPRLFLPFPIHTVHLVSDCYQNPCSVLY